VPKLGIDRRTAYVFIVLLMVVFGAGYAVAAGLTITNGSGENGSGVSNPATNNPAWWSEASVGVATVPAGTTSITGSTAAAPQVFAAGATSYAVNAVTTGDVGQFWKFTEASGATANSELELSFTISTGAAGTITTVTTYVETQATSPGANVIFTFYYDVGAGSTGPIVNNLQVIWLQCGPVGTCP
jgi:hypothetical protein